MPSLKLCAGLFLLCRCLSVGGYELIAFSVDIDDFDIRVVAQEFAKFCDVDIHAPGVKIIVVNPDGLQCEVSFKDFINVRAQKRKKLRLLCCEFLSLVVGYEHLLLSVEGVFANLIKSDSLSFLPFTLRRIAPMRNTSSSMENGLVI